MRVFLDTNVLASGIATRGLCTEVFELVIHEHRLLTSRRVLRELELTLERKFHLPKPVTSGFLSLLRLDAEVVEAGSIESIGGLDSADAAILGDAIAGASDVFVTGDKEILALRKVHEVPILSPRDLWTRLSLGRR